jgi:hypothetical protein
VKNINIKRITIILLLGLAICIPDIFFKIADARTFNRVAYDDVDAAEISMAAESDRNTKLFILSQHHTEKIVSAVSYIEENCGDLPADPLANVNNSMDEIYFTDVTGGKIYRELFTYLEDDSYSFYAYKIEMRTNSCEITEIMDEDTGEMLYLDINYNIKEFAGSHAIFDAGVSSTESYQMFLTSVYLRAGMDDTTPVMSSFMSEYGVQVGEEKVSEGAADTSEIYDSGSETNSGAALYVYDSGATTDEAISYEDYADICDAILSEHKDDGRYLIESSKAQQELLDKYGINDDAVYTYSYRLSDSDYICDVVVDAYGITFNPRR